MTHTHCEMDEVTKKALTKLLTYVIDDEERNFDERDPEDRENHIYRSIHRVAKWQGLNLARYADPEAPACLSNQ